MNSPVTFLYIDPPDVPEGMTLAEYRRARPKPQSLGSRLRRALLGAGRVPQRIVAA